MICFPYVLSAAALAGLLLLNALPVFSANVIKRGQVRIDSPLSAEDVASLRALDGWPTTTVSFTKAASQEAFASLSQLPDATQVAVDFGNELIDDLQPVASLPHLRTLKVSSLKSSKKTPLDVTPLAKCPELTEVNFYGTCITGVDALTACQELREVNLYMADVNSLDFLKSTPHVRDLNLYGSRHTFSGYGSVAGLAELQKLDIYMNPQATDENLAVLKKLTQLRKVSMANSREVTTLGFLSNCTELEELRANWCRKLSDISALGRMPYLEFLDLSSAPVTGISPLSGKFYLETLNLSQTRVRDISPLVDCRYMKSLDLSETEVSDLSVVAGMRMLTTLNLEKSSVSDLTPLKNLKKLRGLVLDSTQVTDLSPLAGLEQIVSLSLDRTAVTDLTPLHGLQNLKTLTLMKSVPESQIQALQAALPELSIRFK